ncbi:MAG: M50 family metallopeptidase [Magnetococcus sp. YQC-9]
MIQSSSTACNRDDYLNRNREILSSESRALLGRITRNIGQYSVDPSQYALPVTQTLPETQRLDPTPPSGRFQSIETRQYTSFSGETTAARTRRKEERALWQQQQEIITKQFFFMLFFAMSLNLFNGYYSPIAWLNTFFHEMSHVLGVLFTGGDIHLVRIYENADGLTALKKQSVLSLFAVWIGYGGEILFGLLIFRLGLIRDSFRLTLFSLILLAVMVYVTLNGELPLIQDRTSMRILAVLYGMVAIIPICNHLGLFPNRIRKGVQILGLFMVARDAVLPLLLLGFGGTYVDALILQQLTKITCVAWMFSWNLMAIGTLLWMWRMTLAAQQRGSAQA